MHNLQGSAGMCVCIHLAVCELLIFGVGWEGSTFFSFLFSFFYVILNRDLLHCHGNCAHTEPERALGWTVSSGLTVMVL